MNLLIHDLCQDEWEKISPEYEGWKVIAPDETIRPCYGCFGCWNRTPGQCVIKDGFNDMGSLIHHAEEVTIISRYTYGGFSSGIKNMIDRCLGYVLPQFEVTEGETHHQKRYDEVKEFTFIFYGNDLHENRRSLARRYVTAMCANFRSHVKDVRFIETEAIQKEKGPYISDKDKTVLLNCSMRGIKANSYLFMQELHKRLSKETECVDLQPYINKLPELYDKLSDVSTIVLCMPLYVDGIPSQVIRLMELFERKYNGDPKNIYILANMGLYESRQLINLVEQVKLWCRDLHFDCKGALCLSAGELIGVLMQHIPFKGWPSFKMAEGMDRLAEAIDKNESIPDIYAEPKAFPRSLYIKIANDNWNRTAKLNGIRPDDLYRKL